VQIAQDQIRVKITLHIKMVSCGIRDLDVNISAREVLSINISAREVLSINISAREVLSIIQALLMSI
jgi:hypothetical protein